MPALLSASVEKACAQSRLIRGEVGLSSASHIPHCAGYPIMSPVTFCLLSFRRCIPFPRYVYLSGAGVIPRRASPSDAVNTEDFPRQVVRVALVRTSNIFFLAHTLICTLQHLYIYMLLTLFSRLGFSIPALACDRAQVSPSAELCNGAKIHRITIYLGACEEYLVL